MPDAHDIRTEKDRLRHEIRAHRRALGMDEVTARSQRICAKIEALEPFIQATCICLYIPFDNEVDILPLLKDYRGKKRIVAATVNEDKSLDLREIQSKDDLAKGRFGILEPKPDCPLVSPDEVGLFLVPGIAFDRDNHRLGFGAGHFDRLLPQAKGYRLGVAYAFQVVDHLPTEAHDIPMQAVVSDED